MKVGDFLAKHNLLPPQLTRDADVLEDILPTEAEDVINQFLDTTDNIITQTQASEFQEFTERNRTRESPSMTQRRPNLHKRVAKLERYSRGEKKYHRVLINVAALANGGVSFSSLFNNIIQGAGSGSRLGDEIQVTSIQYSGCPGGLNADGSPSAQGCDFYLVRLNDPSIAPDYSDFQQVPGGKLDPQVGWTIVHHLNGGSDTNKFYALNSRKTFSPPMRVMYNGGSNIVKNNVYFVVKNDTGVTANNIELAFTIAYYDK